MSGSGVDIRELQQYMDKLKGVGKSDQFLKKAAQEIGNSILELAVDNTPVGDTGNLKQSWKVKINKTAEGYEVEVSNDVPYATYVEYGHRQTPGRFVPALGKKLKKSWVEGYFMLSKAEIAACRNMPELLEDMLINELEKWGL